MMGVALEARTYNWILGVMGLKINTKWFGYVSDIAVTNTTSIQGIN